ncbi:MAG: hypothetical protein ACJAYF_002673 [Arenicella sp.]
MQAACNVKDDVDLVFADSPSPVGRLYTAADNIDIGTYSIVLEHRARLSGLLRRFADYLAAPNANSVIDVFNSYTDSVLGILDSTTNSTNTVGGQNAMRTVNQIGRLFSDLPENILDISIDARVWEQTSYDRSNVAFSRNALRVQLLAARNLDILASTDTVAFAGAVRWNSPNDVVFSGYYTNHPGVSGTGALPAEPFWAAPNPPQYTITNANEYTDWLSSHFYSGGATQIDLATGAPIGTTVTDPLSTTMDNRIRNKVAGTYNNQNTGLPGTHAEVQAANSIADGLSPADVASPQDSVIGVHTVRTTRNPVCTGFECCAGCTDILRNWARSTGGGGTLRDPFRR